MPQVEAARANLKVGRTMKGKMREKRTMRGKKGNVNFLFNARYPPHNNCHYLKNIVIIIIIITRPWPAFGLPGLEGIIGW